MYTSLSHAYGFLIWIYNNKYQGNNMCNLFITTTNRNYTDACEPYIIKIPFRHTFITFKPSTKIVCTMEKFCSIFNTNVLLILSKCPSIPNIFQAGVLIAFR